MTLKHFLDSIQDSKITADLVISDRGRLLAVTKIEATAHVVMLVCRPKPQAAPKPPAGPPMTLKRTIEHELTVQALQPSPAQRRQQAEEERRTRAESAKWERQEVEQAYQSINRFHRFQRTGYPEIRLLGEGVYSEPGPAHSKAWCKQLGEEDKIKAEAFAATPKTQGER